MLIDIAIRTRDVPARHIKYKINERDGAKKKEVDFAKTLNHVIALIYFVAKRSVEF